MVILRRQTLKGALISQIALCTIGCHKKAGGTDANGAGGKQAGAFALGGSNTTVPTPCASHPGPARYYEGSGLCTGNLFTSVTLPTAKVRLHYNSVRTQYTHCLSAGWSFDFERFVTSDSQTQIVTDGAGSQVEFSSGLTNDPTIRLADDPAISRSKIQTGSPIKELLVDGTTIEYGSTWSGMAMVSKITDRNGNAITYQSNSNGCFSSIQMPTGEMVSFSYDSSGRATSIRDNAGSSYNISYDSNGNLNQILQPDSKTWSFGYQGGTSNLIQFTNPLAESTNIEYIPGSPVVQAMTNANNYRTQVYYTDTLVGSSIAGQSASQSDETFDGGYLIQSRSKAGLLSKKFDRDPFHRVTKITDELKVITIFGYSAPPPGSGAMGPRHRLPTSILQSNGVTTHIVYDDNLNVSQVTTTKGSITSVKSQTWDANSHLLSVTFNGKTINLERSNGNVTKISDQNGRTIRSATYDGQGHITSETDQYGLTKTFTWTSGKLNSISDYLGRTVTYSYDSLGQIVATTDSTGPTHAYSYDVMGNLRATNIANANFGAKSIGMNYNKSYYGNGQPSAVETQFVVNGTVALRDITSFVQGSAAFRKLEKSMGDGVNLFRTSETMSGSYYKIFNASPVPAVIQ